MPVDPGIGERIRARRQFHGWSMSYASSRAGIAGSTWSRIERGVRGTDNRFMLAKIAEALNCSMVDLVGAPTAPADVDGLGAHLALGAIRQALVDIDLDEPATIVPRPLAVV